MIERQLGEPARARHSPPTNDRPPREPSRTNHQRTRVARRIVTRSYQSSGPARGGFRFSLLKLTDPVLRRLLSSCHLYKPDVGLLRLSPTHLLFPTPSLSSSSSLFHCLS
ncbi:hypothetical protein B296_00043148 [Ensete ventricosum]|uniref:Uncharacterized protein n=1 Tax=Ensete ventricosum TaxID=4639 RepID=A0A426ZFT5_ENSVE|nr:hypothetical protein B296_00043148 [Ensete ventricosum]